MLQREPFLSPLAFGKLRLGIQDGMSRWDTAATENELKEREITFDLLAANKREKTRIQEI